MTKRMGSFAWDATDATKHVGLTPRGQESGCKISCAVTCAQLIFIEPWLTAATEAL